MKIAIIVGLLLCTIEVSAVEDSDYHKLQKLRQNMNQIDKRLLKVEAFPSIPAIIVPPTRSFKALGIQNHQTLDDLVKNDQQFIAWVSTPRMYPLRTIYTALVDNSFTKDKIATVCDELSTSNKIAALLQKAQFEYWRYKYTSPKIIFVKLQLVEQVSFAMPLFRQWIRYVKTEFKTNHEEIIYLTLRDHFPDVYVADICEHGFKDQSTELMAKQLAKAQIEYWHTKVASSSIQLYIHLRLWAYKLESPLFHQWLRFAEGAAENKNDVDIYLILHKYRTDNTIAALCDANDRSFDSTTTEISERLKKAQIEYWLTKYTSPKELLGDLKLTLFDLTTPVVRQWISFVENTAGTNTVMVISSALLNTYTDDKIAKICLNGFKSEQTKPIVEQLQKAQIENWHKHFTSTIKLFKQLGLKRYTVHDLLFQQWFRFAEGTAETKNDVDIYLAIREDCSDQKIALMCNAYDRPLDSTTTEISERLKKAQIQYWHTKYTSPKELLGDLMLTLFDFTDPVVHQWISFVEDTAGTHKVMVISSALLNTYTDDKIAQICQNGFKSEQTKAIAEQLQKTQIENWRKHFTSSKQLYEHLELKRYKLYDLLFQQWFRFAEDADEKTNDMDIYLILREDRSDNEIATLCDEFLVSGDSTAKTLSKRLGKAQIEYWHTKYKSPKELLDDLKLPWFYFITPVVRQWISFVEDTAGTNKLMVISSVLLNTYTNHKIAQICQNGLMFEQTKAIAEHLQKAQIENWRKHFISSIELFKQLGLNRYKLHDLLFQQWIRFAEGAAENKNDVDIYSILRKYLSDNEIMELCNEILVFDDSTVRALSERLKKAQIEYWRTKYTSPEKLLVEFDLDRRDILTQPLFLQWTDFVEQYFENPKDVIVQVLYINYGDEMVIFIKTSSTAIAKKLKPRIDEKIARLRRQIKAKMLNHDYQMKVR